MNTWKCSVPGCQGNKFTAALCAKHWARLRKHGDVNYVKPYAARTGPKNGLIQNPEKGYVIDSETGCWNWQHFKDKNGYGRMTNPDKEAKSGSTLAHIVYYVRKNGPVPAGLELDHLCRNHGCVNPDHLEAVTHAENMRRGIGNGLQHRTHCDHGHEFTPANTKLTARGVRACRMCMRISSRNLYRMKHGIPLDAPQQKTGRKT